jgi:intein/homing endonuclease
MTLITIPGAPPRKPQFNKDRRPPDVVLNIPDPGASPRGNSYWKVVRGCPREHALRNIVGIKKEGDQEALTVGLTFHYALEVYYRCIQAHQHALGTTAARPDIASADYFWGATSDAEKMAWRAVYPMSVEPGYEDTYAELERMLASYLDCYRRADKWRIVAVEETLAYADSGGAFGTPGFQQGAMEYSARLDLIVEDYARGGLWVVEHKCLAGDSMVWNAATGQLQALATLVGQPVRVYTGTDGESVSAVVTPNGVRDVYRVTTSSGRFLDASDNHPFLTARGWVPAAALHVGDWVASPATTGVGPAASAVIPDADVALMGYMLGDGTMRAGRFTKSEGPTLDRVRVLAAQQGYGQHERRDPRSGAVTISLGAKLRQFLRQHGVDRCRAAEKFIPSAFFSLPDRQVGLLLGALWSTDGCVDVFAETRNGSTQQKVRIAYASRSEALCRGVQTLLLRLGLDSTVCQSSVAYRGGRRPYWTTKVVGRTMKRAFLTAVVEGRIDAPKYALNALLDARAAVKEGDDRVVPVDWVGRDRLSAAGFRLSRGATAVELSTLQRLGLCDVDAPELLWQRVKSVFVKGREMTYDLSMPTHHQFVANDLITHNTAKSFTEDLIEGYQLDQQIVGQVWLLHACVDLTQYPTLKGVTINLTSKTKTPKHQRVDVCPSNKHIVAFEESLRAWNAVVPTFERHGWPKALGNCSGPMHYFKKCEFFDVCHGWPDVSVAQFLRRPPPLGFVTKEETQ